MGDDKEARDNKSMNIHKKLKYVNTDTVPLDGDPKAQIWLCYQCFGPL